MQETQRVRRDGQPVTATHDQIDMSDAYEKWPGLREADTTVDHRFEKRRSILNWIPRWKVGAELGVFTGAFSELLVQVTKPSKFYAIDPWWEAYGEQFPNWGHYTSEGRLETRGAHAAALLRMSRTPGAEVIVSRSDEWLNSLASETLDWIYLDSTHQYNDTLHELRLIDRVLTKEGIITGDDGWANRDQRHYGVFRAVRDFCRERNFEIVQMDYSGQWALRRTQD